MCHCVIFGSWWRSSALSQAQCSSFYQYCSSLSTACTEVMHLLTFETSFKNCMVKYLKDFIWMFANIFNKVIQKNNARYISQKMESLFLLCTWGILHIGLWLTRRAVCAGWGTCGVQREGGKTQCIQVQILNKHSVKLVWILTTFMDSRKYMECC